MSPISGYNCYFFYWHFNKVIIIIIIIIIIKKYIILRVSCHLQVKRLPAVVQRVDNAIHPRNRYPVVNCQTTYFAIHRIVIYPVDSVIHPSDNWGMPHDHSLHVFFSWADVNKKQIWIWYEFEKWMEWKEIIA